MRIDKGILCSNCYSRVHRRRSKLSAADINDLTINKWDWNLSVYMNLKFPFNSIGEKDLIKENFNSKISFCAVTSHFVVTVSLYNT